MLEQLEKEMEPIYLCKNRDEALEKTGYTFEQIISLSGVDGIDPDFKFDDYADKCNVIFDEEDDKIVVDLETDKVEELIIEIKKSKRSINIVSLKKGGSSVQNLALKMLISMVKNAVKLGFTKVKLQAFGKYEIRDQYNGYVTWGLLGFIISDKDGHLQLQAILSKYNQQHGTKIETLYDLLIEAAGKDLWVKEAHQWMGIFTIAPESQSIEALNREVVRKELAAQGIEFFG